ncbi:MAG: nucleotidyltransferase domain-containing protein [Nanoarchaeota archaeon]|nr:nucleotidyltransferase domain-containing protein [Nanoarchaeota archaeon]MBU0963254.1 nucleotidyltransferase domain-containing protein [Nanoarchaeota archaeon]
MKIVKNNPVVKKDYDIAYDFATKAYKEFKEVIKTIVLFGSVAKFTAEKKSDVDLIIIVDDCTINWDDELISWYKEELAKLLAKESYRDKIHINTVTLSSFWDQVRVGDPVIINIIRYGQSLIDFGGFFEPLKVLLARGKIRATPESIYTLLKRAPDHIARARLNLLGGVEALYWSMVDSSHAALMAAGEIPPSPEQIPELLTANFVKSGKINKKYIDWYQDLYDITRQITHGKRTNVSVKDYQEYEKRAEEFLTVMFKLTNKLLEKEKIIKIEKRELV